MITIGRESPDQAEIAVMFAAADLRSAALYPRDDRLGPAVALLLATGVRFFVARDDGRSVGCGGYVLLGPDGAELKRLFVDPASRGSGVGGSIVNAIEVAAGAEGAAALWLETGVKSIEAMGLYRRLGFIESGPFGSYRPDRLSVFMVKRLA